MAVSLTKVSGVLIITDTAGSGRYYGATAVANAKFNPNTEGTIVFITIAGDSYNVPLADLRVNSQTPATMSTALVLLNSIFGT